MTSTNGYYDQALLADAPVATKAQLQEGYNADLLRTQPNRPAPTPDFQNGAAKEEGFVSRTPHVPFWRTTKGIVIIVIAVLVVLGAVIGGAVGGTAGKHKNNTDSTSLGGGGAGAGSQGVTGPSQNTNMTGPFAQNSTTTNGGPSQNVSVITGCDPSQQQC